MNQATFRTVIRRLIVAVLKTVKEWLSPVYRAVFLRGRAQASESAPSASRAALAGSGMEL